MLRALRAALWFVAGLGLLYGTAAAALFVLMRQSNVVAGKALALVPGPAFAVLPMETMWCAARKGDLTVGAPAPDFDLAARDGSGRVRLSSIRAEKPVVLVFGSYTCRPFRKEMPEVNKVYADYRDRAAFYFVYIEEAHARDVWPLASNERDGVVYRTPLDMSERNGLANTCAKAMKIEFPMLVDDLDNNVAQAYTAWPTRFYVVDRDGRIAFKSRPGPFGFEAQPLRQALASLVSAAGVQARSH
jgi:thiol-disulfide isomerase/thioredoxin